MEITMEQVEKVRSCTGASYEEAKAALEACHGGVLDAVILLEQQGKCAPAGGGYSTRSAASGPGRESAGWKAPSWREVRRALKSLLSNCLAITVEVWKPGSLTCVIPLLAALILCLLEPWLAVALFFLGLCFGYRVHIAGRGTEEWGEKVNRTMDLLGDTVHDAAASLRKEGRKLR